MRLRDSPRDASNVNKKLTDSVENFAPDTEVLDDRIEPDIVTVVTGDDCPVFR